LPPRNAPKPAAPGRGSRSEAPEPQARATGSGRKRRRRRSYSEADEHLRSVDHVLRRLIDERGPIDPDTDRRGSRPDAYQALARAIVGQQLSTKAARSIYDRLTELFGGRTPSPAELLAADPEDVRSVGLSRSKVAYLRSLAEHVESGELELARLSELSDDDVSAQLTAVKGLGQWTADMFLIFHLRRPDVLPVGDLGIRRAVERAYDLPEIPDAAKVLEVGEPWRPNRSLASLYLWRSLDNEPV
jgi:DNA-3-methyladenine glycosylase II